MKKESAILKSQEELKLLNFVEYTLVCFTRIHEYWLNWIVFIANLVSVYLFRYMLEITVYCSCAGHHEKNCKSVEQIRKKPENNKLRQNACTNLAALRINQ